MSTNTLNNRYVLISEAASMLGISPRGCRMLAERRGWEIEHISRLMLLRRADVRRELRERKKAAKN